jgi:hypothetical protein
MSDGQAHQFLGGDMKNSILGALLVTFASGAGYADPGACDVLKGKTFLSVNQYPMGENPDGIVFGNYRVSFARDGSEIRIREHDYTASGPYTCDNREGKFVLNKGESVGTWTGFYNAEANILLLEGIWYRESK